MAKRDVLVGFNVQGHDNVDEQLKAWLSEKVYFLRLRAFPVCFAAPATRNTCARVRSDCPRRCSTLMALVYCTEVCTATTYCLKLPKHDSEIARALPADEDARMSQIDATVAAPTSLSHWIAHMRYIKDKLCAYAYGIIKRLMIIL